VQQIKARFVTELLGESVGGWLGTLFERLKDAEKGLIQGQNALRKRLADVELQTALQPTERKRQAALMLEEVKEMQEQFQSAVEGCRSELNGYGKYHVSPDELALLRGWVKDFSSWADEAKSRVPSVDELVTAIRLFSDRSG